MDSLFARFFPTPEFLKIPAVGLDISDKSIHFVELLPKGGAHVLGRFGEKKIPAGIMESGKIKNTEGLKKELAALCKETGLSAVNVSLPEEQGYLVRATIPRVKKSELRESIEFQLEEYIPLKAEEAVFDYEIIEETEKEYDIEISALPRAVAESYFRLFEGTGLEPAVFEIEAQALSRAVVPKNDKQGRMIVDFGATRTGLSVVSDGVVMFTSTLDIGGHTLNSAIEKNLKVSAEEAERLKRESGLTKNPENKNLFTALMQPVSSLKDEVNKHFVYWHTREDPFGHPHKKIESIILCGGDSNLLGLADYLSANLRIPVRPGNVWENVNSFKDYIPPMPLKDSLRYATAIGLSLGSILKND